MWDSRNRLTSIIAPGFSAGFAYDALGRRTGKTVQGVTTNYLYDGLNPVQEKAGASVTANILPGLGIDEYFTRTDSTGTRTVLPDALGSTLALTDSTGTLTTQYTYEPFGNTTPLGATSTNSFQYTARENDGTGLYYYRARYYSPRLQRFISEDPIRFAGGDINLYAYVGNSPVDSSDPSGLYSTEGHNYFHDEYFKPFLPDLYIDQIKAGSRWADSLKFQGPDFTFMHAMSSSALSPEQAKAMMCEYVKGMMIVSQSSNDPMVKYWYLGAGLQPVEDSTSPVHRGFQRWRYRDSGHHGPSPFSQEGVDAAIQNSAETLGLMQRVIAGDYSAAGCKGSKSSR
jgi:RHS repeat-associated protein